MTGRAVSLVSPLEVFGLWALYNIHILGFSILALVLTTEGQLIGKGAYTLAQRTIQEEE